MLALWPAFLAADTEALTTRSVAEARQHGLLITEFMPSKAIIIPGNEELPIAEAWLEQNSHPRLLWGRARRAGFNAVMRFNVQLDQWDAQNIAIWCQDSSRTIGASICFCGKGVIIVSAFFAQKPQTVRVEFTKKQDFKNVIFSFELRPKQKEPIQPPEATPTSVTPPAGQEARQP